MMCSTLLANLGYECHPVTRSMVRVISPYTYCDDGEHVGAFLQEMSNHQIKVTDRCDALLNMESRGISVSARRMRELRAMLSTQGVTMNERGEIAAMASENNLAEATSRVIRAGILASSLSLDWYKLPKEDAFRREVTSYLKSTAISQQLVFDEEVFGGSGHKIKVPITVQHERQPKYLFTTRVREGANWNPAYGVLGRLMDLRNANPELDNRFVIIDDEAVGDQFNQLASLFADSCQVLPFRQRDQWLELLAA